jgi:hypothetical protein
MVHRHAAGAGYIVKRADLLGLLAGSAGTPLAAELSQELAEKLGDIDGVRVHTGSAADAASRYLQADAFVLGRNIFFARGKFDPGSQAGQRLIAHEVAHTAQPVVEAGCEITVSSPGDEHEQAADAFADAVMAGGPRAADVRGEPARLQPFAGISRSVAAPFTSETARNTEIEATLALLETSSGNPEVDVGPPTAGEVADAARTGSGERLPGALAAELESATGRSLDHVRIHRDAAAGAVAADLAATAFTYGSDIFFAAGAYDPTSQTGRAVIAHEVLHTLQPQAPDASAQVTNDGDAVEREAEAFADSFTGGPLDRAATLAPVREVSAAATRTRIPRYPGVVPSALAEDKQRLINPANPGEGRVWEPSHGYIKNPTATNLSTIVAKGKIGGGFENGKFMYVIDEQGEIWVGKRLGKNMPHPTLLGGRDPKVRAAGMVEMRAGKIVKIDNHSGHFRPPRGALTDAVKGYLKLPKEAFNNLGVESVHFDRDGGELRQKFRSLRLLRLKRFDPGRSISRLRARYKNDPRFRGRVGAGLKSVGKAGLAILATLIAEYFIGKWIERIEVKLIRQDIETRAPEVEAALQKSLDDQADVFDELYETNPDADVRINIKYRIVHVELRDPDFTANSYAGLSLISAEVSQAAIEEGVKPGGSSMCIGSTQKYQDLAMSEAVKLRDLYEGIEADEDDDGGSAEDKPGPGAQAEQPGKLGRSGTP